MTAAVGGYDYGIHVYRGGPSWEGGPRTWRRTDPHQGCVDYAFAWYRDTAPPVDVYTRAQYEAACASVGLEPADDATLGSYADTYGEFAPPEYPPRTCIEMNLRRRRIAGLAREAPAAPRQDAPPTVEAPTTTTGALADRQATQVAEIIGLPAPAATGRCHYCGLPLNRSGQCEECV